MADSLLKKIFGDTSSREVKKLDKTVNAVLALESRFASYTDQQLRDMTPEFKKRLADGQTLDDILPEAFAVCREAAKRVLNMQHFPVQITGGIILHQGRIAEMKTGEGKTLVATLPAYLNALTGKGVHIVTVNDYLAKRDSDWMGKVYRFLGLSVGCILHDLDNVQRRAAYDCDITYGTNNEIGFDYLRDNMAIYKGDMVQRGHVYAIVDEIDSILIDEARTPLIISGAGEQSTDLYQRADRFAAGLTPLKVVEIDPKQSQDDIEADYIIDEKAKSATITPRGVTKAEKYFNVENLSDPENSTLMHHIDQAIKARGVMRRDVDYVIRDGEIIIVDEFTGRLMFGRRYSDGLHQAIEAKENVQVMRENRTLATITFQNYFRLYTKLSGMTGTALTEEEEFRGIYGLDVIEVPTNKPMIREDHPDRVYKTEAGKFRAVIELIRECHAKDQPVLVGTVSIEKSELLSSLLKRQGISHQVLNAKYHEKEAQIVAQAGSLGAVTIATNMAGRGTDIVLGGNPEYLAKNDLVKHGWPDEVINEAVGYSESENADVLEAREFYRQQLSQYRAVCGADADKVRAAGGLYIIGTERHESRRIDNQLRGRSGRQGDPGESMFFLSLEDDLLRLFGSERVQTIMDSMKIDEDTPIDAKIMSRTIESSQKRLESRNYQSRKTVLEYDDVMNTQRNIIYGQRLQVLEGADLREKVLGMVQTYVDSLVDQAAAGEGKLTAPELSTLMTNVRRMFPVTGAVNAGMPLDEVKAVLNQAAQTAYEAREKEFTPEVMREVERVVLLRTVDRHWMDHIDAMSELRRGVSLNVYAQVDPVTEYKRIGFDMFEEMIDDIRKETAKTIFAVRITHNAPKREKVMKPTDTGDDGTLKRRPVRIGKKPGRNDPCPCGSGKKYKNCCGR